VPTFRIRVTISPGDVGFAALYETLLALPSHTARRRHVRQMLHAALAGVPPSSQSAATWAPGAPPTRHTDGAEAPAVQTCQRSGTEVNAFLGKLGMDLD
jgi:hypothetical protein